MSDIYNNALNFWNQAFDMRDEDLKDWLTGCDTEDGSKELASADKLRDVIIRELSDCLILTTMQVLQRQRTEIWQVPLIC